MSGNGSTNSLVPLHIRRVIYENFNDVETKFTNDEILELMKKGTLVDESVTIDDLEKHFEEICDAGLVRNIAQNFTTIWFKLFDAVEKIRCSSCDNEVCLGKTEDRKCPNPECGASI